MKKEGTKRRNDLDEEVQRTKDNIGRLKKAKKLCGCGGRKPHYHVLLQYDAESGEAYFETSEKRHQQFIAKLGRELERLQRVLRN